MTIDEIVSTLNLTCVQKEYRNRDVHTAYTSDLLSDVMANADESGLLITIQAHKNTVAVATLTGIVGVILCNDRPIPPDMVEAAAREQIAIFTTSENQFTVSGRLYALLTQ